MTTYTEEGCPYKDHCSDPYHHHDILSSKTELEAQLDEPLKRLLADVDDAMELSGTGFKSKETAAWQVAQALQEAKQALIKLVAQREQAAELRGRIGELGSIVNGERDRWSPLTTTKGFYSLSKRLAELKQATKPEKGDRNDTN